MEGGLCWDKLGGGREEIDGGGGSPEVVTVSTGAVEVESLDSLVVL